MHGVIVALLMCCAVSGPGDFKAGVARKVITPTQPLWMSGYSARTRPSEGVVHDLWAKALALEDSRGELVVIVTTDLIGLPREVSDEVAARVKAKHHLERGQLLLNSAHTHSGPAVWPNLEVLFDISARDRQQLIEYRGRLIDALVEVVGAALADLSPATLEVGHGSAALAVNRRQPIDKGHQIGVNPAGPVDRDVPVLKIAAPDGKVRAVLFGYACHNTTLGGDSYLINGDYAGFAQIELEKALPGATAMFLMLCGADQNPHPRGTPELAAQHGKTLAQEVQRVLAGGLEPVSPAIRTRYENIKLDFVRQDRAVFEQEAKSGDRFRKRRAEAMLAAIDAGRPIWQVAEPVQVVGLGEKLVIVALGGEPVVDYSLRLKREYPRADLIVAGYSNEVMCYIPSRRILHEGGYEAVDSMIYYGQPGPFVEGVEETLIAACHRLLADVGVKPATFKAGVARKVITPTESIWMSGYAARARPSEGVLHDLWAKALALEDPQGRRAVIVTIDLIGLPREMSDEVAARAKKKYGLERGQLMLNSSHTHCGPAVLTDLDVMLELNEHDQRQLVKYSRRLTDALFDVVGAALADLRPATVAVGHGSAPFACNRRQPTDKGFVFGANRDAPADHDVPVLSVAGADGKLRAVVFGYACHNTTFGSDCCKFNGDYAGFAQIELEKALPGATAMFLAGCGGDQNPQPRIGHELAAQHGKTLADAVRHVLAGQLDPVGPAIRTGYEDVNLDLVRQDRAMFEKEANSSDRFAKRRAEAVLAAIDAGRPIWRVPEPVQVVGLGDRLVILALGGEPVVDYSLRLKREYPRADLIVAGYSNDVMCYIPSRRVLKEGGYEAVSSMIYSGYPGPFVDGVEETLIAACHRLLAGVGVKPATASDARSKPVSQGKGN